MSINFQSFKEFRLRTLVWWIIAASLLYYGLRFGFPFIGNAIDSSELPVLEFIIYGTLAYWLIYHMGRARISWREMFGTATHKVRQFAPIHLALPLFLFSVYIMSLILHLIPKYLDAAPEDILAESVGARDGLQIAAQFLLTVIIAPILEELVFRKVLLHNWAAKWGLTKALIFTSILFGILHFDFLGAILFGLVLGVLYISTRSIKVGIAIHMLNNLIYFLLVAAFTGNGEASSANGTTVLFDLLMLAVMSVWIAFTLYIHWPKQWSLPGAERASSEAPISPLS